VPSPITGTVTDTCDAAMPGVDVTVKSSDGLVVGRAVSGADGAFRIPDVEPGHYAVTASEVGFRTFSDPDVAVGKGWDARLRIRLRIAFRVELGPVTSGDIFHAARSADAIVHLRIERVRGAREVCGVATQYQARVVEPVKRDPRGGPAGKFELLQQGSGRVSADGVAHPDEASYSEGDEFVALLTWNNHHRAFLRLTGRVYMIPIRDGKVSRDVRVAGVTAGMPVGELLEKLKSSR
jgi:hypothetical protein